MIKPAHLFTGQVLDKFFPSEEKRAGFGLQWEKMKAIWFGRGEMSVWTGYNGHGKSMFLNQVMLEAVMAGERIAIGSYEMTAARTLHRMVKQSLGKSFPDELEISNCLEWLGQSVSVHDHLGQIKLEPMLRLFEKEVTEKNVTQVVIDSLMKLGMAEDDYNGQKVAADRLQSLAQKTGCHIHLVAHPRKGISEAEIPGKMDIAGTGAISNMADNVFTVWRNKHKWEMYEIYEAGETLPRNMTFQDIKIMKDAILLCSKCREEPEAEKKYGLFYMTGCMQYHDQQHEAPYQYYQEGNYESANIHDTPYQESSSGVQHPLSAGVVDAKTRAANVGEESGVFIYSGGQEYCSPPLHEDGYLNSLLRD